jgi:hypothetical protein
LVPTSIIAFSPEGAGAAEEEQLGAVGFWSGVLAWSGVLVAGDCSLRMTGSPPSLSLYEEYDDVYQKVSFCLLLFRIIEGEERVFKWRDGGE